MGTPERLLHLLADGELHSGVALGAALGVSRAAISKAVRHLLGLGVSVESVQSRGYRLCRPLDLLNAEALRQLLSGSAMALPDLQVCLTTDSTSRVAAQGLAPVGCRWWLVAAEHQSQGRGRRGRNWFSELGQGLCFTLGHRHHGGYAAVQGLSLAVGLAIARYLDYFGVRALSVKWPNDLFIADAKLCGILIEMSGESNGPITLLIGVGLNVYPPVARMSELSHPMAVLSENVSRCPNRTALLAGLVPALQEAVERHFTEGLQGLLDDWHARDYLLDREVVVQGGEKPETGIYRGIDAFGRALVEKQGRTVAYSGGEISLRARA